MNEKCARAILGIFVRVERVGLGMGTPERSVKRPIRSAGLPSTTSRVIGSKHKERRLSRCGTRQIRCETPGVMGTGTLSMTGMLNGVWVVDTMVGN